MLKVATKFVPEPRGFEAATTAGFRSAEFWLDASWLDQWQEIVQEARQHSMSYALHFPNRSDLRDDTVRAAAELYGALDCCAMVIHAPMWRRYGERLLEFDPSLRLGVENHRLGPDEFTRWATENSLLTLDVEHLWKFTLQDAPLEALLATLTDFLTRFSGKLVHVHLPGYAPGCDEHRPMFCSREMVVPVLSLLADHEFDGLVGSDFENSE